MKKLTCKKCSQNYRTLTKEGLCAKCHKDKWGTWAPRFSNGGPKRASGED